MDVYKKVDIAALQRLSHHFLHAYDLWRRLLNRIRPLAVEIEASQTAAIVPYNDAVWVEHRHDFKDECIT